VTLESSTFVIPAENLDAAFTALKDLNKRDDLKHGGRFPRTGDGDDVWFSWMDPHYDRIAKDAADIFGMLGFEYEYNEDGDLCLTYYDSKSGDEDQFLGAVAPFVQDGSMLTWRGEDGAYWRQVFEGGTMTPQSGTVVFS
jgi:hypothetical protein